MTPQQDIVEKLKLFLKRLYNGEFSSTIDQAIQELNLVLERYDEAYIYFSNSYIRELYYAGSAGKSHILFLTSRVLEDTAASLARALVYSLMVLYKEQEDPEILSCLVDIILKYSFDEFISIESTGENIRLEANGVLLAFRIENVRLSARLDLLQLALRKYANRLVFRGPPSWQDLPAIIQRLNSVIASLTNFSDKGELGHRPGLHPFAVGPIGYDPSRAFSLFGNDVDMVGYEDLLFKLYRIPLFPFLPADELKFNGNKLTFQNEGLVH